MGLFSRFITLLAVLLVGASVLTWTAHRQSPGLGQEFREIVEVCRDLGAPGRDSDRGAEWEASCAVDQPDSAFNQRADRWQQVVERRQNLILLTGALLLVLIISLAGRGIVSWRRRRSIA